jgi:predicted dienelactone hydrolase
MFAGIRQFELVDEQSAARVPVVVMYPTLDEPAAVKLGPYTEELSADARIATGAHPLVIISHGSGGSPLVYRGLAAHLARAGFIVAAPEHPGNNRNDNRLADSLENFEGRPRQVSLVIDGVLSDSELGPCVARNRIAVIGHSMGGYTALAVAGGAPRLPHNSDHLVGVKSDPRVKALVLLAPATPWYMAEGSLAKVNVPILMLTGEHDHVTPSQHGDIVKRGLADLTKLRHRCVPNAGHFSFLSPFPEFMRKPGFPPGADPEGFDRAAFQAPLANEIRDFLEGVLLD